ncbi:hypothetical protein Cgig2_031533 [Carnegiea gigantea]|uniref:Uncharacterized protein n=1 Tax=Carnegiea gigantea TaxID=171969 RepID=A0A9Q1K573_9CARY|nr:hypothetical protein Cgig2_031533 [Carnegiea gigantea]
MGKGQRWQREGEAELLLTQFLARELAATMYLGSNNHHRVRRHHHHRLNEEEGIDRHHPPTLAIDRQGDVSDDHHRPSSAGSLRRHIAASLMRHHQFSERNKHALQPLSPASYGSSLEMAAYNPAATPDSSVELRGRIGESSYSFKTSTELLKVLNRIWSLEEQHASNMSLVKSLKNELVHARTKIKELLRDQQANRHQVDELMKQISEGNLARKSKEQERIDAALRSVREELENERKLRKRSESLHRKLARELFEIKVSLSTTVKELEKERKSTELLEELCDEFAKGIREYARHVHDVRQKSDKDWTDMVDHDNLILHISESWLDERMQMKDREKSSIIDRLRPEIEAFIAARQISQVRTKDNSSPRDPKEGRYRHQSLESIPERTSAPQCTGHEDPAFADARADEISKAGPCNDEEQVELVLSGRKKSHSPCTSVQMSDPQNAPQEMDDRITETGEGTPTGINMLQKSEIYDALIKEGIQQRKKGYNDERHGSNSKTVDKLMSELVVSEGGSFPAEYESKDVSSGNPALRRNASPVRQWMNIMRSPDPRISNSSSKNVLAAKLQEPKSKEHKSKGQRSRLKFLKGLT